MIGTPIESVWDSDTIYHLNFVILKENIDAELSFYISEEIYKYYHDEIGIDRIIAFLIYEDEKNGDLDDLFNEYYKIKKMNDDLDNEDDDEDLKTVEKWKKSLRVYNNTLIKSKLVKYFLTEMVYEIPSTAIFCKREDVINFIKMYEQKFLYELVIPNSD